MSQEKPDQRPVGDLPDSPSPRGTVWELARGRVVRVGGANRPWILGVINLTTDSFFQASRAEDVASAVHLAARAQAEGADGIDLGAESTRPGASSVPWDVQLARVAPAIRAIRASGGALARIPISIDTTDSRVARAAIDAGADLVNDVSAGRDDPAMLPEMAACGAGLILMHRLTTPAHDSYSDRYATPPVYQDVVRDVRAFLVDRIGSCERAGVPRERITIDPGLGFGKSVEQNLALIAGTPALAELGRPVVSALSRKSFVGRVSLGRDSRPEERLPGTLALSVTHQAHGASIFRVHDVGALRQALDAAWRAGPHASRA
jgi:dihydropteroate synthase